mgnify:CR=1 FL=1
MPDDRMKISENIFRKLLAEMDSMSRTELISLQLEDSGPRPEEYSPALYHIIMALRDLARAELINRDLMG